jgi:hypothetical protein
MMEEGKVTDKKIDNYVIFPSTAIYVYAAQYIAQK